ncbi:MAG TPA: hypothetical protein VF041_06320 [Gemmatimonadaceae bacterium]
MSALHPHHAGPWASAIVLAALLFGCVDAPTAPTSPTPPVSPEITSGEVPGGQRSLFFLSKHRNQNHFTGQFDPTLRPEVVVCRTVPCTTPVFGPLTIGGAGSSATLTLDAKHQRYVFRWHTTTQLEPNAVYRLTVLVGHYQLGWVDLATGAKQKDLKRVDRREFLPVRVGSVVNLPFRIEKGAPFPPDLPGRYESAPDACPEGCDIHANPTGEFLVVWGAVQITQTGSVSTGLISFFSPFAGPPPDIPAVPAPGTGPLGTGVPGGEDLTNLSWRIADDDPSCLELWNEGEPWGHWCGAFGGPATIFADHIPFSALGALERLPDYVPPIS